MSKLITISVKDLPTIQMLRRLFGYDPEKGVLVWKLRRSNRIKIGALAGTKTTNGYLHVTIKTTRRKVRIGVSRIV